MLTNDRVLPAKTKAYLDNWQAADPQGVMIGVGGQAVTATAPYHPINLGGADRYETAIYVAQVMFGGGTSVGVTIGTNWPDALAGGALLGTLNAPLLLTPAAGSLNAGTAWELSNLSGSVSIGYVFGGGVPAAADSQVGVAISGPGSYTKAINPPSVNASAAHNLRTTDQVKAAAANLSH